MRRNALQALREADGIDDPLTGARVHRKPIGEVRSREHVAVSGTVGWTRLDEWVGGPVFEVGLTDATGAIRLCFLGRRRIDGIRPGAHLVAVGTAGLRHERLVILNPDHYVGGPPMLVGGGSYASSSGADHRNGFASRTAAVQLDG